MSLVGGVQRAAAAPPASTVEAGAVTATATEALPPPVDAVATAALLAVPETARDGVWATLRNLGIGVRRVDGEPLLVGAERSADDFWVIEHEVDVLAAMTSGPRIAFTQLYELVAAAGFAGTLDELAQVYTDAYRPGESFLGELFGAAGATFTPESTFSQFEAYLMLVDLTLPVPRSRATGVGQEPTGMRSSAPTAPESICGFPLAADAPPASWGVARQVAGSLVGTIDLIAATLLARLITFFRSVEIDTVPFPVLRAGVGGPGEPVALVSDIAIDLGGSVAPGAACDTFTNVFGQLHGPAVDLGINAWRLDGEAAVLVEQAGVAAETTFVTDAAGRAQLTLVPRASSTNGEGVLQSAQFVVVPELRLADFLERFLDRLAASDGQARAALLERLAAAEIDRIIGQTFLHDPIVVTIEYWEPTVPGSTASAAAFPSACALRSLPAVQAFGAPLDTFTDHDAGVGPARRTLCWWGVPYGESPTTATIDIFGRAPGSTTAESMELLRPISLGVGGQSVEEIDLDGRPGYLTTVVYGRYTSVTWTVITHNNAVVMLTPPIEQRGDSAVLEIVAAVEAG